MKQYRKGLKPVLHLVIVSNICNHRRVSNLLTQCLFVVDTLPSDTAPSSPVDESQSKKGEEPGRMMGILSWAKTATSGDKNSPALPPVQTNAPLTSEEKKPHGHTKWASFMKVPDFRSPGSSPHASVSSGMNQVSGSATSVLGDENKREELAAKPSTNPRWSLMKSLGDAIGDNVPAGDSAENKAPATHRKTPSNEISLSKDISPDNKQQRPVSSTWLSTKSIISSLVAHATKAATSVTPDASPAVSSAEVHDELVEEDDDEREVIEEERVGNINAQERDRLSTVTSVAGDDL